MEKLELEKYVQIKLKNILVNAKIKNMILSL